MSKCDCPDCLFGAYLDSFASPELAPMGDTKAAVQALARVVIGYLEALKQMSKDNKREEDDAFSGPAHVLAGRLQGYRDAIALIKSEAGLGETS